MLHIFQDDKHETTIQATSGWICTPMFPAEDLHHRDDRFKHVIVDCILDPGSNHQAVPDAAGKPGWIY